jgi:hypothetical protein
VRPDLLIGFPADLAKALTRVFERHHEQVRPAVFAVRGSSQRALAIVDLGFLARQELEHIEALRLPGS